MHFVKQAKHIGEYKLNITFETGEVKCFDMAPYLETDSLVFRPLKQPEIFQNFTIDGNTVTWITGADIAPERLYSDGILVSK